MYKYLYRFHKIGFYIYSVKFYYQDNKGILSLIKGIFKELKIFFNTFGYYEYLEIPITNRCSLNCRNCSNLIPYYNKRFDYDIDILSKSIKEFLSIINNIVYIRIMGGEPFLSNNIVDIINILIKSDKVQRVEIVTNGTIVPNNKRLKRILRSSKVIVCISDYKVVNNKKLILFLEKNNINYRVDKMKYWYNYGNIKRRNKSNKEVRRQFRKCHSVCKSLINGQIHLCPRSSHGTDLGIISDNGNDYLDLLDDSLSMKDKKKKFDMLLKKKYIKACYYCDYATNECNKVGVAEQIEGDIRNEKG